MKFRDYSLKRKLISTLVLSIVLPLTIISVIFLSWIFNNEKEKICRSNINMLQRLQEDIDRVLIEVEDTRDDLVVRGWFQKMLMGKAKTKDYVESNEWYANAVRNRGYLVNFALAREDDILFQRGWLIDKIDEQYTDALKKGGLYYSFWTNPYEMDVKNIKGKEYDKRDCMVISNFYGISDGSNRSENMGILSISIAESAVADMYQPYLSDNTVECLLMREDGTVLSAMDNKAVGNISGGYQDWKENMTDSQGYFEVNYLGKKTMAVYSVSDYTGWILLQFLPNQRFSAGGTAYVILLLAIGLCIIFGFVFNRMQKIFIVQPLQDLMEEMKKLKEGNFDIRISNPSKDEIGIISREFAEIAKRLEKLIQELYLNKIYTQEAELELLTSQINPHFLYNTLDSIHWEAIRNRDYSVGDQLEALSDIFRHILSKGKDKATVREEMRQVENYMALMEKRYGNKVKLKKHLDVGLLSLTIPKLLIQPLVENALLHGLEPKPEPGYIQVEIQKESRKCMRICVSDNGVGTNQEKIQKELESDEDAHNIFALKNINRRLILMYGEEYAMQFKSEIGKGTEVTLRIPFDNRG